MDDGSFKRNNRGQTITYTLNTQGFSYADQKRLVKALGSNFGFELNIWKDKEYYVIAILAGSIKSFENLVKPYILPCFLYIL